MINLKSGMQGRYRIEKAKVAKDSKGNEFEIPGTRKVCSDWFDNLILNQGLNEIGTEQIEDAIDFCHVGNGSTPPEVTDAGLESFVASTSASQLEDNGTVASPTPYIWRRVTKRFGPGDAAGNLSEVGMGWTAGGSTLFSRALIVDSGGSPTSITVASDEVLDVTYELRIYPPESDFTGTIVLDAVTYDYTARASEVDISSRWDMDRDATAAPDAYAYSGVIGDIFNSPSGFSSGSTTRNSEPYSNNSMQGSATSTWGLNDGNIGGIRSVRITVGWTTWQIEFSAQGTGDPIPKDNTYELALTVTHSWSRGTI